jgi:DNA polymerase I
MTEKASSGNHIYLIDGSGYIFRAYHALPPMTRSDGTPVNAVLGFSNMLFKLLQDLADGERPTHFAVIFDAARKSFRNDFYPDYKAHRPPAPDDLVPQFPLIRQATEAFNVPAIEMPNYEADDLIATYALEAKKRGFKVTIVSSDKDLMQLVGDGITMFDSMKNRRIGVPEVMEKFGVGPERVIDVQALAGDSVDNVPGVPGIGVKTAAALINEYGDLDRVLEHASEIKQNRRRENLIEFADQARISRRLVTLKVDVPVVQDIDDFKARFIDADTLAEFAEEMELRSLKAKIVSQMGSQLTVDDPADALVGTTDVDYTCITKMAELDKWIADIRDIGIVTLDTETTSLNAMSASLVGISLSLEAGKAAYIPLRHVGDNDGGLLLGDGAPDQLAVGEVLKKLKPIFEDPAILKIGQNIKYDALILLNEGINITPIDDTMLMSYALECGLHGHGMDELSKLHLAITPIPFKEICGTGKKRITFDKVPLEKATQYAAEDADITGRLHRLLKPQLGDEGLRTVYETLERPLVPVLVMMEHAGIKVDRDILARLSNDFAERLVTLEARIHQLAGRQFNVASPKQLGEILFDELGLPGGKKGKTGAYATGAEILEKLATDGHELAEAVLAWRQLAKLKSTYTDTLQNDINQKTGRVHTSFSMAATSTGRLASSDPNIQNIPVRSEEGRKIREAFIAEPGSKLIAADYSQIELRLLAHIAGIEALKDAFSAGMDIHAMTASEIFGVPVKDMDPMVRRRAKAINFGIIYGISAFGLARQLDISRTEAGDYIEKYFERFPGIRHYMDQTIKGCRDKGYVETIFGRRCHINMINDKNPMRRAFGERAAINAPIQGSAADVIRRAMVRMPSALGDAGFGRVKMLLQVHDELIFEAQDREVDGVIPVIRKIMEQAALPVLQLSVPITVDVGIGSNWNQAH